MKNKLSCNVVQDLIPSYAENLVSAKTQEEILDHLNECSDCANINNAVLKEVGHTKVSANEVDFLKIIRRQFIKMMSIIMVVLIFFAFISIFIGVRIM